MASHPQWKVESRQRALKRNFVGEMAGHNYLVLVDPSGKVVEDLNNWRPDPFEPFDRDDRSELGPDRPDGRTRFAEEDDLPVPTDLAQLAVSAARRKRRRRRRRHGQLA